MLKPNDDVTADCSLRVWFYDSGHKSLVVFMHPSEWRKVSIRDGTHMIVRSEGYEFRTVVNSCGEHFRIGRVDDDISELISLPHGDYEATAEIVWEEAIPELVLDALNSDPILMEKWRSQPVDEIRDQISVVRRARNESSKVDRQLALIRDLRKKI